MVLRNNAFTMTKKEDRIAFAIDRALLDKAKEQAVREDRSLSGLVRRAISHYIEAQKQTGRAA